MPAANRALQRIARPKLRAATGQTPGLTHTLATRAPQLAATRLAAVEKLSVFAPSPPVPTMSIVVPSSGTGIMCFRIARTIPATSRGVSTLARSRTRKAAHWCASAPFMTDSTASCACSSVRSSRATSRSMVSFRLGAEVIAIVFHAECPRGASGSASTAPRSAICILHGGGMGFILDRSLREQRDRCTT